jgi:hypothetical protein
MIEMEAKRFDTARRLARRAAAIGVSAGVVGVHPEQVLAEIDRRERAAQVVIPTVSSAQMLSASVSSPAAAPASGETRRNAKVHAIELLDQGLLALDQKRFDEAEQCAHKAADLQVMWGQYDYRPENLLVDILRERTSAANPTGGQPVTSSAFDARHGVPRETQATTEGTDRNPLSQANSVQPYQAGSSVPQTATQIPSQIPAATPAGSNRAPAQSLLEQAMDDLRAGRNELARQRLEQAMNSLPGNSQAPPMASFGSYSAAANRPVGLSPSGINPAAAYPTASPQVFFPIRRDQQNVVPAASTSDVALKPMHDPYLGDEPTTTDKLGPAAQSMRESMPTGAPISQAFLTKGVPDPSIQRTAYDSDTPRPALVPRVQTNPETPSLNPQIGWLEKMSTPMPPMGMPAPTTSQMPSQRGYNGAPIAPPASADTQWPAGRIPAQQPDPAIANSPDQPKPGFFQKIWGAISGD